MTTHLLSISSLELKLQSAKGNPKAERDHRQNSSKMQQHCNASDEVSKFDNMLPSSSEFKCQKFLSFKNTMFPAFQSRCALTERYVITYSKWPDNIALLTVTPNALYLAGPAAANAVWPTRWLHSKLRARARACCDDRLPEKQNRRPT